MNKPDPNNRIHAFAGTLAEHIGGEHVPTGAGGEYRDWCAQVLTDTYGIFIRQDNRGKRLDVMATRRNRNAPDTSRQWPRGSVAIGRPINDQVRDIVRRVIHDPELQACVDDAKLRADRQAEADRLKEEAFAVLEAAGAKRSPRHAEEFHQGPGQGYFQGRVEYSGQVTFTRLGSVSPERAARIIALLAEGEGG